MQRAARQPLVDALKIYGGVFVKQYTVPDFHTLIPQHSHDTSHLTAVVRGAVRCWRDGELLGEFHAPALIEIPAKAKHTFMTLTPEVRFMCIHALAEGDEPPIHEEHQLVED